MSLKFEALKLRIDFFFLWVFLLCRPFPEALRAGFGSVCLRREGWVEGMKVLQGTGTLVKIWKYFPATLLWLYPSSIQFHPRGAELQIDLLQCGSIWGWSVLTCCWQSKKNKNKKKAADSETKKKVRPNSWSVKCQFSVELKAALALSYFSVSQRSCHFSWSVFLFPCSTVHHWILCCLGNSIRGSSWLSVLLETISTSMRAAFCAIWGVFIVFLLLVHSLVLTQWSGSAHLCVFLGRGSERKELSTFQRWHRHHHVQVTILMPVASHCISLTVNVRSINVFSKCATLSAGHLGQRCWLSPA